MSTLVTIARSSAIHYSMQCNDIRRCHGQWGGAPARGGGLDGGTVAAATVHLCHCHFLSSITVRCRCHNYKYMHQCLVFLLCLIAAAVAVVVFVVLIV